MDEASLACEELAVDAVALLHNRAFPLPERPVPTVVEYHVAAVLVHHVFSRKASYAAVKQGQKTDLLYKLHQFGTGVYLHL